MVNILSGGFTDTHDNQKNYRNTSDPGPYIAVVKDTEDPLRMGRLGVVIPALSFDGAQNVKQNQIWWCQYLSPFYGAKPFNSVNKKDPYNYKQSQNSYGMWAVPPDIDTNVLVIFAQGNKSVNNAFWIGCIQEPLTNHMVPGLGSSTNSKMDEKGGGPAAAGDRRELNYGTTMLPVVEKNKRHHGVGESIDSLHQWRLPVNEDLANQLRDQGLVMDDVRGTTTSSARRETPSRVFGISTPGRFKSDTRKPNIGIEGAPVEVDRGIGHSFVMDDGDEDGKNQLTRLRTASGHQLLMNDTEGVVYLANGSGKAWIEMEKSGKINIYSDQGISIRAEGDFNLHSDKNIQFHAKENIRFTAEKNLNLNAEANVHVMGNTGVLTSSQIGKINTFAQSGIESYTPNAQKHGAGGRIDLAGSQVHFNSVGASAEWGPGWLTPDHVDVGITVTDGMIDIQAQEPIKNGKPIKIPGKTTVMDTKTNRVSGAFVTHEPYDRTATKGRDEDDKM